MEYGTYEVLTDLIKELKLTNEKIESLEVKFFHFESKLCDVDEKVTKIVEATEGISSSFGEMNISPDQVQGVLNSFGLSGQSGGQELVDTLQVFRSKLGELSGKLSQISHEVEKV